MRATRDSSHKWDGTHCNYETVTDMRCNFADSHVKDVSSYIGPYTSKVNRSQYDDFEEWYIRKEHVFFEIGHVGPHAL
jgi:hypothetical protein